MSRSIDDLQRKVSAGWAKLGMFSAATPAEAMPDLESLVLDTVRVAPWNMRLLELALTWIAHYGECVAKRRLAVLAAESLEMSERPVLGLLLASAQASGTRHRLRFHETIALCSPAADPGPLSMVMRRNDALREISRKRAIKLSQEWGRWVDELQVRSNLVRPRDWVARENPGLAVRALTGGDLAATLAADAAAGYDSWASESVAARRYKASRAAIRDALHKLALAGIAVQRRNGRNMETQLTRVRIDG